MSAGPRDDASGAAAARWMTRTVFGVLVGAVCAHIWFASAPLPLGGPNVWLAGLAALGALACVAMPVFRAGAGARRAAAKSRLRALRPIAPALAVAGLAFAWAVGVSAAHGAWDYDLLAKMPLGLGVLLAAFVSVNTVRRGQMFALALLGAIAVSALFGLLLRWFGDPFTQIWLSVASVRSEQLRLLFHGGVFGLAVHPSTFGCQLAVAMPMAVSAVVWLAIGRRRWRVAGVVAFGALLALLVTSLLASGSRASVIGTGVGVCAGAALWLLSGEQRGRAVCVLAAAAILLAMYVWFWLGSWHTGAGSGSALADARGVRGLVAGAAAEGRAGTLLGHRFGGHAPGVRYEVALQEQHARGRGSWRRTVARADADGRIALAWQPTSNARVLGYRFKSRLLHEIEWPVASSDEYFTPSSIGPVCVAARPAAADARLVVDHLGATASARAPGRAQTKPAWVAALVEKGDPDVVSAEVRLRGRATHRVQVRACAAHGVGPVAETRVAPGPNDVVLFTWRGVETSADVRHQFRSRAAGEDWGPWRNMWARKRVRGPAFGTIGIGGRALVGGPPAVGHVLRGLVYWHWHVVQIRTRRATGFDAPLEISARPDFHGRLVLAWAEPEQRANVLGYQFRLRAVGTDSWGRWRDFQPALSSRVPVPMLLSAPASGHTPGSANGDVRRHTLTGMTAGLAYNVQLRAWNEHGYGAESEETGLVATSAGGLPLAWRLPKDAAAANGYQFRLRREGEWLGWQDLAERLDATPGASPSGREQAMAFARTAHDLTGRRVVAQQRFSLAELMNASALSRVLQVGVAWRHVVDHPLGTGAFAPNAERLVEDPRRYVVETTLHVRPHNQFLHMAVVFGVPGFVCLVLLYVFVARACVAGARVAAPPASNALRFLAASAVGSCVAYFACSMLLPTGPLLHHWDHFFVLGLLFCVPALRADERGAGVLPA